MNYVTRFAPSPTGLAHLGNFRTAYFNWLAAKASGGNFFLRIDNTDADRNDDAYVQTIFDSMDWLGLEYDYSFRQSDTAAAIPDVTKALLDAGFATTLDNGAIALVWHDFMPRVWNDSIAGDIVITDDAIKQINGLILVRGGDKLGQPTYNYASVVDDYMECVNYIIRGTDHIPNTSKQVAIWSAMAQAYAKGNCCDLPKFAHVGLITMNKKKLSKRDSAVSLLDYRDKGIHPDAMLNFMLRLGWSPSDPNFDKKYSLITRDMAVDMFFKDGSMRNSPAGMDLAKLDWYDRRYKALK